MPNVVKDEPTTPKTKPAPMTRKTPRPAAANRSAEAVHPTAARTTISRGGLATDWGECDGSELLQLPGLLVADTRQAQPSAETAPRATGLCASCIHAATCTFPRPTGGVWSCEEYE